MHRPMQKKLLVIVLVVLSLSSYSCHCFRWNPGFSKRITHKMASSQQDEVNKEWNAMAGEWDDLATEYRNGFVKVLWERTGLKPDGSLVVLDFGCGTGLLAEVLQNKVSSITCVDAAPLMVQQVEEKIQAREWKNVKAHCAVLANLDQSPENVRQDIESLSGKVDLVVASSVLSFIPQQDLPGTMKKLGELLRPNGGVLCHSDWPKSEKHEDGMTEDSAMKLYEMAGLEKQSTDIVSIRMMGEDCEVFVGVAVKK